MNILNFDMTKKRDIVAIGRSGVDFYPDQFGPMEQVESFHKYLGGSPANTTVQMAKMGLDVGFIGMVSNDQLGNYIRYYMNSVGVDVSQMVSDPDPRARHSLAIAEQPEKGQINYFFYRRDCADLDLRMEDVKEEYIAQFKGLLVSGTSLCKSPVREAVLLAITYAKRNNVRVIFDPDYRPSAWDSVEACSINYWDVAKQADAIFSTREETDVIEKVICPDNKSDEFSAKLMFGYEPLLYCIKHGGDGSVVYTKDGEVTEGKIYPAHVYKSLGAGDSFAGAFLSRLVKNDDVETALKYAAIAASITISGKSCAQSMPTLEQVESYIEAYEKGEIESWDGWNHIV